MRVAVYFLRMLLHCKSWSERKWFFWMFFRAIRQHRSRLDTVMKKHSDSYNPVFIPYKHTPIPKEMLDNYLKSCPEKEGKLLLEDLELIKDQMEKVTIGGEE